jgi:hypothetical protein
MKNLCLFRSCKRNALENGIDIFKKLNSFFISLITTLVLLLVNINVCQGVPSFARQTGLSCAVCHSTFPELNSFGRLFKLNGYTMTNTPTIDAGNDSSINRLSLLSTAPISSMVMASYSRIQSKIEGTQNGNIQFPQQLSLFYAGQISRRLGTFIQLTYDPGTGAIGMDNTDIRFANHLQLASKDLLYGFTLNNNPTVQDVWNTVPAWRYPYASSGTAPAPSAATLIEGSYAGQVAGLGAYGLFDQTLYYELSLYRSAPQGLNVANPPDSSSSYTINGVAPYWRIALQHQFSKHYLMIGTFGMSSKLYPTFISGANDRYTDIGIDLQYEYNLPSAILSVHSSLIHEKRKLDATFTNDATNLSSSLNSFKIDGNIYFNKGIGLTLGYFNTMGDQNSIYGTLNGIPRKPDSNGTLLELNFLPWYNTKFSIQYVMYNKFDGLDKNYDGNNRNASQNNTLYCLAWFSF